SPSSPRRSCRSPASSPRASRTRTWRPSCSSRRAPSSRTCETSSRSSPSPPAPSSPGSASTRRRRPWPRSSLSRPVSIGAIFVLSLGALDLGLEQSIILPALPALQVHYGASVTGVSWLVTGFVVSSVVAVPLLGRLGDLYGKRRMLLVCLA